MKVWACPTWDLSLVLGALTGSPFELEKSEVKWVVLKAVFLISITSARRVSELQALSIREPFLLILEDRVVLKTDSSFLPKVSSAFHRTQDLILPTFYSTSEVDEEGTFSLLDNRRSLLTYQCCGADQAAKI